MNISEPVAQAETTTNSNKSSPRKCPVASPSDGNTGFTCWGYCRSGHCGALEFQKLKDGLWTRRNMRWSDRMYYFYYYEMNRKLRQRTIIEWFLWIPASSCFPARQTEWYMCRSPIMWQSASVRRCEGAFCNNIADTALIQDYVYEWQFPSPHSIHSLQ